MPEPADISKIALQIDKLERTINSFTDENITPYLNIVKEMEESISINKTEFTELLEKLQAEFKEKVNALYDEQIKANRKAQDAKGELQKLTDQLRILQQDQALYLQALAAQEKIDALQKKLLPILESLTAWKDAMDFQMEDIFFQVAVYETGKSGVLNANEMGLGKTFETAVLDQVLNHLFQVEHGRKPRCIWLTKKSLVKSSANEIKKWSPERTVIPVGVGTTSKDQRQYLAELAITNNALVIANYDALGTTPLLMDTKWDFVYIDEVHKLKGGANPSGPTALWQNAKKICDNSDFKIFLSGSPIMNHPREMWAYLHLFEPDRFPSVRRFEQEYCYGYGAGQTVNFENLIQAIKDQTVRRRKHEVSIQLPDLTREFRMVEMEGEQLKIYNNMKNDFFVWLDQQEGKGLTATAIIAQLTRLRQIALVPSGVAWNDLVTGERTNLSCTESAKLDEAMEIINEIVLGQKEQVVVFSSQFNEPLYELKRRCNDLGISCSILDGKADSGELEKAFQQKEIDVLAINMRTGSEGLNLQKNPDYWPGGACDAIFLDLWWNPASNEQAEARIHRKGQTHAVTIHIIQAENSVDAFIANLLEDKENMIKGIMEDDRLRKNSDWKTMLEDLI